MNAPVKRYNLSIHQIRILEITAQGLILMGTQPTKLETTALMPCSMTGKKP